MYDTHYIYIMYVYIMTANARNKIIKQWVGNGFGRFGGLCGTCGGIVWKLWGATLGGFADVFVTSLEETTIPKTMLNVV